MQSWGEIKSEHDEIRTYLFNLELLSSGKQRTFASKIAERLIYLGNFWNKHEIKEEKFFSCLKKQKPEFAVQKMKIEHRDLRRRWKVVMNSVVLGDKKEIGVLMDSDWRMFADKLRKHMSEEEELFERLF